MDELTARIDKLEKQMAAMIDRYNMQENRIERMGFDLRFIRAWIDELRLQEPQNGSGRTITGEGIP